MEYEEDFLGEDPIRITDEGEDTGFRVEPINGAWSIALERAGFAPMSSAGEDVETVDCNNEELKQAVFAGMDDWWRSRFSDISEIEKVENGGKALRARIDAATYDLDDDDADSLISRLRAVTGHTYEWRDDYEAQVNGTVTVTLEQV